VPKRTAARSKAQTRNQVGLLAIGGVFAVGGWPGRKPALVIQKNKNFIVFRLWAVFIGFQVILGVAHSRTPR